MGRILLGIARGMARRNGRQLAKAVAAQLSRYRREEPTRPAAFHWEEILENRPGWRRVRRCVYEFRAGQRVELKAKIDRMETLRWLANAELKPLAAGLQPLVQNQLLKESTAAALEWWRQNVEETRIE